LRTRVHITVDASLKNVGGALGNRVYRLKIGYKPGWSIVHWEAVNILVSLRVWAKFIRGKFVAVWCYNAGSVSICTTARGRDSVLNAIVRNIWLLQAQYDVDIQYHHIRGSDNMVADLLLRWDTTSGAVAKLYSLLNNAPIWEHPTASLFDLDMSI
jgi:hypothetical protein